MNMNTEQKKSFDNSKMPSVLVPKLFPGYQKEFIATKEQLEQIAKDFSLERVDFFKCSFEFKAFKRGKIIATGKLTAHFPQNCVSSGVLINQVLENDFEIIFEPKEFASKENFSMSEEDCEEKDIFYYEEEILPLGEVALEQFALEIPPYPRAENYEDLISGYKDMSASEEKKVSPFDVLKKISFKSK
ncbi:DUF177 domain-containing protein [Acetobacteraceae bacterium]|nr:DUF177 domain-containing protein [Acetobacteraceae bacterium]